MKNQLRKVLSRRSIGKLPTEKKSKEITRSLLGFTTKAARLANHTHSTTYYNKGFLMQILVSSTTGYSL